MRAKPARVTEISAETIDARLLLKVLSDFKKGDFTTRLPSEQTGLTGKIYDSMNEVIDINDRIVYSGNFNQDSLKSILEPFGVGGVRFLTNAIDTETRGYDLVISSSHAFAKAVRPPPGVPHVCYCHSPPRYLWDLGRDYRAQSRL